MIIPERSDLQCQSQRVLPGGKFPGKTHVCRESLWVIAQEHQRMRSLVTAVPLNRLAQPVGQGDLRLPAQLRLDFTASQCIPAIVSRTILHISNQSIWFSGWSQWVDATLARSLDAGVSKAKFVREAQFKEKAVLFKYALIVIGAVMRVRGLIVVLCSSRGKKQVEG